MAYIRVLDIKLEFEKSVKHSSIHSDFWMCVVEDGYFVDAAKQSRRHYAGLNTRGTSHQAPPNTCSRAPSSPAHPSLTSHPTAPIRDPISQPQRKQKSASPAAYSLPNPFQRLLT